MVNVSYDASGTLVAQFSPDEEAAVYNNGDMAFIMVAAVLVMIMAPGVAFLYSGLLRRKNALSMLLLGLAVYSVATIQWFFWGYTLAFSTSGPFIGNLSKFGFMGVLDAPSVGSLKVPELLYAFYQSMFAGVTAVIIIGGMAERARILPILVFTFIWGTIVYAPVAHWVWEASGWLFVLGDLDFAGGGPVHITSGTASLAWSIYLGKRRGYGTSKLAYRPHSVSHIILGTCLIWFGWFGFNGGSELAANLRSVQAMIVTNLAAAMGGLTWMFMDSFYTGKYSAVSLCSGILAGLVAITPAAGYVGAPAALAFGLLGSIACNYATSLKIIFGYDDAVDGFALHGIGGLVGSLLTGLLADSRVTGFDGYSAGGGWINKNYRQLGLQMAGSFTIMAYTFVVTYAIIFVIDHIPGLKVRSTEEAEILGIDETESGETNYDFVYLSRDIDHPHEHDEFLAQQPLERKTSSTGSNREAKKSEPQTV